MTHKTGSTKWQILPKWQLAKTTYYQKYRENSTKKFFPFGMGCALYTSIRKKVRKKMNKTIANAVKRMKQEERIAKAYAMPIVQFDAKKNDEAVKKFFEQFKK